MTPEDFANLARAVHAVRSVVSVHPLKLAKWHQALFELPESLFLQLGCGAMFDQLTQTTKMLAKMAAVLGSRMDISFQELAVRQVGFWTFHVPSTTEVGTRVFLLRWEAKEMKWYLHTAYAASRQPITSFDDGLEKATVWSNELDTQEREDGAELLDSPGKIEGASEG
jgi:hypothetical protein